jgi:hypothetical protein
MDKIRKFQRHIRKLKAQKHRLKSLKSKIVKKDLKKGKTKEQIALDLKKVKHVQKVNKKKSAKIKHLKKVSQPKKIAKIQKM